MKSDYGNGNILRIKIVRFLLPIFAPLLSGVLMAPAFPNYNIAWLAWVGLVPLLLVIYGKHPAYGFLLSLYFGIAFFTGIFDWTLKIPGYKIGHHAILLTYLALYIGILGLVFCFIARRAGVIAAFVIAPFAWVCLEFIRSNLGFMSHPWVLLAYSQFKFLSIIQISSVTGAYGVSFLIVAVNSVLAIAILAFFNQSKRLPDGSSDLPSKHNAIVFAGSVAALLALVLMHGKIILSNPSSEQTIKLSVVQGNIDSFKKANQSEYTDFILQRYINLTRKVAEDKAALIIWPEAATPGLVLKNMGLLKKITSLIQKTDTYFLIGSSEYPKFQKVPMEQGQFGNTALFFSPKGKVLGQYLKIRLVPFGEYIPYKDTFPWPEFIVPDNKKAFEIPGKEFTVFDLDGAKFSVIICWENAFPSLFRQFVKNGANFMINLSNEGWFGESAPYQMVAISVFRAVENQVSLTRSANTGISCFIDKFGRVRGRVLNGNKDIFVEGFLTQEVQLSNKKTFYTLYGDIFVYICMVISFVVIITAFMKSKTKSTQ